MVKRFTNRRPRVSTIRDVARVARVSIATVSNVHNGTGRVSKETRDRVLKAARVVGYAPNQAARELVTKQTGLLGALFPYTVTDESSPDPLLSYFAARVIAGVEQAVRKDDFSLLVAGYGPEMGVELLPAVLRRRRLEGLFVIGGLYPQRFMRALRRLISPLVFIGVSPFEDVDSVVVDNRQAAALAVSRLAGLGHRRIGFINGPTGTRTSGEKLQGYMDAMREAGLDTEGMVAEGDFSTSSGYRAAMRLLGKTSRPTGLFVADDPMAIGVLRAARKKALSVPRDLAVVGFGDSPIGAQLEPPLTTVHAPAEQMGGFAAQRMLDRLRGNDGRPITVSVKTRLVVRRSCGAYNLPTRGDGT